MVIIFLFDLCLRGSFLHKSSVGIFNSLCFFLVHCFLLVLKSSSLMIIRSLLHLPLFSAQKPCRHFYFSLLFRCPLFSSCVVIQFFDDILIQLVSWILATVKDERHHVTNKLSVIQSSSRFWHFMMSSSNLSLQASSSGKLSCQISVNQREAKMSANVNKKWKTCESTLGGQWHHY